jgi:hypothetical protein
MAGPFDQFFGDSAGLPFGPNSGITPPQDTLNDPLNPDPERLPWGLDATAQPQDQYLQSTPNDSARFQPGSPGAQQGQGFNPLAIIQQATRGLFANPAAQQQQQAQQQGTQSGVYMPPRPAAQSGTIMGFLDSLNGVPTSSQLKVHEEARQQANTGGAAQEVLKRIGEIKSENPDIPQTMLQQQIFSDPAFLHAAMKTDPTKMAQFVDTVVKGMYGTPTLHNVPADASVLAFNPQNPTKGADFVYQAPKTLRPGDVVRTNVYDGGDPLLPKLGINGTKTGTAVKVEMARDATGQEYVKNVGTVGGGGVTVNMGDKVEMEQLQKSVKAVADIKQQQVAVVGMVRTAERLDRLLSQTGAGALGPYGFFTQVAQSAVEQAKAIATDANVSFNPDNYTKSFDIFKGLDKRGAEAAAIKTNILSLAMFIARANNRSGNLSNRDVDQALTQIGGRFGSLVELRAGLGELIPAAVQHSDDYLAIEQPGFTAESGKAHVTPPRPLKDILGEQGLARWAAPAGGNTPGDDGVPVGTEQIGPDGKTYVLTKPGSKNKENWKPKGTK